MSKNPSKQNQLYDISSQSDISFAENDISTTEMDASSELSDTSKMDTSASSSIFQDGNASINVSTSSTKKIKLSVTEKKILQAQREELKKEREQLRAEREKAKIEKEKERIEKEKERIEKEKERVEKEKLKRKQKEDREAEKEKKLQELQQKKMQLEKEKNEKLRLKEEERERREREKREKENEKNRLREEKEKEKQRRNDEKSAIEEKKKQQDELEAKKLQKQRDVLSNFLKKSQSESGLNSSFSIQTNNEFSLQVTPESLLESFDLIEFQQNIRQQNVNEESLYLNQLLSGKIIPYIAPQKVTNDDCEVIEDFPENVSTEKYIFLQFHENIRPAYFGKKTHIPSKVNGRNPFAKEDFLEYDVDSDEEWDEGGPGESLSGSDSDHEEVKEDYEIDDEFFVPHGYLSDDENNTEVTDVDPNSKTSTGPLLKEQTLMAERNRKFANHLTPQVIGCVWYEDKDILKEKFEYLQQFKAVFLPN